MLSQYTSAAGTSVSTTVLLVLAVYQFGIASLCALNTYSYKH